MDSRKRQGLAFALIIGLSIGFAYLSTSLNVLGTTTVSRASWDVHFENVQVSEGSVYAEEPEIDENETTVSYNVHLDLPGDFYEFTVDAVNDGTIDAMIETFSNTEISSRVAQYLTYSVTYSDGGEIAQKDVLDAKSSTTYKIRVEYLKDIDASDLDENGVDLELSFGVEYVQSTVVKPVEFIKMVKTSALSDTGINFKEISSDSNGNGLYVMESTKNNTYPIYYYRGNVNNNNAKFAGFCWKIVRTTDTGGTKLLYNGTPNENGECTSTTGNATQIGFSAFNTNYTSVAYMGYMYGTVYESQSDKDIYDKYTYGSGFTFSDEDGTYTLTDQTTTTSRSVVEKHHYTCLDNTGTCSELYYVHAMNGTALYYIALKDGKSMEDALSEMQVNKNDSTIKIAVDNWFNNTFKTYFTNNNINFNDYLEDTIWCNDRSINSYGGWQASSGGLYNDLQYDPYRRMTNGKPSLICSNKNDSFTVEESATGNGALTYPVGLLTIDEVILAGGQSKKNENLYLYTGKRWATMSPQYYTAGAGYRYILNYNSISNYRLDVSQGLRPSISLKHELKVAVGGDGTSTNPYEFIVE